MINLKVLLKNVPMCAFIRDDRYLTNVDCDEFSSETMLLMPVRLADGYPGIFALKYGEHLGTVYDTGTNDGYGRVYGDAVIRVYGDAVIDEKTFVIHHGNATVK